MAGRTSATLLLLLLLTLEVALCIEQETRTQIDQFVEGVMQCRNVPAMAVTVVTGQTPAEYHARGYGEADMERGVRARSDTRFAVGSLTKAFTVTLLAILMSDYKGKYNWDTPVRDIMGDGFRFADEQRTRFATLRDLAAHKMGLYSYVIPAIAGLDDSHTPMDYCRRMRYLKPYMNPLTGETIQMRTEMIYSNAMFMLLGCIAEKLGNDSYSNLLHNRLLKPLNMSSSGSIGDVDNWVSPDFAQPYVSLTNGSLARLSNDVARGIIPFDGAGAIYSSSTDMVRWILYHMSFIGVGLADPALTKPIYEPQFASANLPRYVRPHFPFSDEKHTYDMGWTTGTYRGYRYIDHGGLVSAFGARLRLYWGRRLGIFVDTNGPMYLDAYYARMATVWYISDLLLGLKPFLNVTYACSFPALTQAPTNGSQPPVESPEIVPLPVPHDQASKCLGQYGHPLFGNVTVTNSPKNASFLELRLGKLFVSTLGATPKVDPRHPDLLGGSLEGDLWYFLDTGPVPLRKAGVLLYVVFAGDTGGAFGNFTMRLPVSKYEAPITFTRGFTWDDGDLDVPQTEHQKICGHGSSNSRSFAPLLDLITFSFAIFLLLA